MRSTHLYNSTELIAFFVLQSICRITTDDATERFQRNWLLLETWKRLFVIEIHYPHQPLQCHGRTYATLCERAVRPIISAKGLPSFDTVRINLSP